MTCAGVFGTGAPAARTTIVPFIPGWMLQNMWYVPVFG